MAKPINKGMDTINAFSIATNAQVMIIFALKVLVIDYSVSLSNDSIEFSSKCMSEIIQQNHQINVSKPVVSSKNKSVY